MSRSDRLALLLSFLAVLISYGAAGQVFEFMAHLEDEMAYVWQAQAITRGHLTVPTPPEPKSFLVPFVVDLNGQRFGKYPLGWPAVLAVGVLLGARSLVNPLLAGLGVWLTYRLGQRTFGEPAALLAAALTTVSPFFLLNSGSLLSHPLGLVLSAGFALAWLDAFGKPISEVARRHPWFPALTAGLALGALALTRPMTAVAVAFPFTLHGLFLLIRGSREVRLGLVAVGLIVLALGSLHILWQYAVTGDPFLNPYTLWWEYDKIGFGPGVGRIEGGHSLRQAWVNTRDSLNSGAADLFGWSSYSWIFLPLGLLALFRNLRSPAFRDDWSRLAWLPMSVFFSLLIFYLAYWVGSSLFGPRYYYEGLFSLTLLTGAGICLLAGWPVRPGEPWPVASGSRKTRPLLVMAVLILLVAYNLFDYLPGRMGEMYGLYSIRRERLEPFLTPEALKRTPALVVVHPGQWTEYGALLELTNPFLDTPFLFVYSRGPKTDSSFKKLFPDRNYYHYYTDEPGVFYTQPRP